ncbi:chromate efflux transporter [Halovulum dunhuangense]|uniref:Chromate efflux transporter n=1 Tax=Halovulum dunhuangense TaxID=1505036 RepID=A0A849L600_9RHOB|nr:chromate efflux transporter [Halovulum dunhuangense]NNU81580.1 chromate efflux transporter [Halovulum dunhuangense]
MGVGSLKEAIGVYVKIGLLSFGGPAGQIALMQDEIVDRRGWVSPEDFRRGLSVAMVLPGPEAQQLATWLGWRLHGVRGGMAAGLAFILPGAALMILLAWVAAAKGSVPLVAALFYGIQPAVLVIVARALRMLAGRTLKQPADWALASLAFLGIWALGLPFPLIVALAALAGLFLAPSAPAGPSSAARFGLGHVLPTLGIGLGLIALVWGLVRVTLGPDPHDGVATLFTSAAFVSFGGAYALLPYVAERAVETYGWLSAAQMLNGLAIAEATPGPLILVNTYAGFFAGWSADGTAAAGATTAVLATFYTFAPSFMLILAVAPFVAAVEGMPLLRRALAGVSAAVVGVVLNLAVYLGTAALLPAGWLAPEWPKVALLALFAAAAMRRPWPMHVLVIAGALAGIGLHFAGLIAPV